MFAIFVVIVEMILSHRSRRESNLRKIPCRALPSSGIFILESRGQDYFSTRGQNRLVLGGSLHWIFQPDTREEVDIEALNLRIAEIVARQNVLRTAIDAIVATL